MLSYDSTRKANAKPSMHPNTLAKPPTSIIPMASDKAPKPVVDRIQLVGKWVSALECNEHGTIYAILSDFGDCMTT